MGQGRIFSLVPKVRAAVWEGAREVKLRFAGGRKLIETAIRGGVRRKGDGVSRSQTFPKSASRARRGISFFRGGGDVRDRREPSAINGEVVELAGEAGARDAGTDAAGAGAHVFGREGKGFVFDGELAVEVKAGGSVLERDGHAGPAVHGESGRALQGGGIFAAPDDERGLSAGHDREQDARVGVAKLEHALRRRAAVLLLSVGIPAVLTLPYGGPGVVLRPLLAFTRITRFNDLVWGWIEAVTVRNPYGRNWPFTLALVLAVMVIVWKFRADWRRSALWVLGAALLLSPVVHPWYLTWILPLAVWRGQIAWTVLSLSVITALLLWETTSLWTAWQPKVLALVSTILAYLSIHIIKIILVGNRKIILTR